MVFKRRDKRSIVRTVVESFWPRGGWTRAFHYIKHRLRRLPDPPHRIARGIMCGVMATFTPFFGFHFVTAWLLALLFQGNILAALLTTFVGNPLTFPIIAAVSLQMGHWILGTDAARLGHEPYGLGQAFSGAMGDLWHNFLAIFTAEKAYWGNLKIFSDEVFMPYLVGGILPGIVCGIVAYYVSLPVLVAYQKRRKGRLAEKLAKLRAKKPTRADGSKEPS